jgi:tyrosine-protein kinase Etk/Wzc
MSLENKNKSGLLADVQGMASDVDLHRVAHEVWQSRTLVIFSVLAMLILGALLAFRTHPNYETNALVQVKQGQNPIGALSSLAGMLSSMSVGSSQLPPQAQVEATLMSSRYVLGKVVDQLHLDISVTPNYFPIIGEIKALHYQGKGLAKPFLGMSSYPWGGEQLSVASMRVSDVFLAESGRFRFVVGKNKSYTLYTENGQLLLRGVVGKLASSGGKSPAITMMITKMVARPGVSFFVNKLSKQAEIANLSAHLSVGAQEAKTGILNLNFKWGSSVGAVHILNTIINTAYALGVKQQEAEAEKTLSFLNNQLPTVKAELSAAENALSNYQTKTGNLDISIQAQVLLQQVAAVNSQLEQLKLQRTELLQKYTKAHPFVQTLNAKIKQVQIELTSFEAKIRELPGQDKGAVELMRDVKTKNQLYLMLLSRAQGVQILRAGVISNLTILDFASEPPLLLPVKTGLIISVAGFAGLLLSVLFILGRYLLQQGVQDPEQVEAAIGVPTQAIVPYSKEQSSMLERILLSKTPNQAGVLARTAPKDIAIEALRSLRTTTALLLMDAPNNIIAITGTIPGIGKSFVSLNFAHVLADMGKRVLLVDTDMRKGKLHQQLDAKDSPGLSDYLHGTIDAKDVVQCIEEDRVYFIPKGAYSENTSELMMGNKMQMMLDELAPHFDIVLLDTAPVLIVADGVIASSLAGTTLLVVGAGKNSMKEIRRGMTVLENNNVKPAATIFNHRNKSGAGATYYYDYAYKYYDAYNTREDDKD